MDFLTNAVVVKTPNLGDKKELGEFPVYLRAVERKDFSHKPEVALELVYTDTTVEYSQYSTGVSVFGKSTKAWHITLEEFLKGHEKCSDVKIFFQEVAKTVEHRFNDNLRLKLVSGDTFLTGVESIDNAPDPLPKEEKPLKWLNPRTGLVERVPRIVERRREKGVLFACE